MSNEIDVSKCPFFRTMEQCDYKQLQQLKQENNELKKHNYEHEKKYLELNCKNYSNILKLEKIKDRVQDIKFDDEKNIEVMNDILQIIESEGE